MSSSAAISFSVVPRRLDELGDRLRELVVLDDDRLDDEVGLEADFVERLQVGGVGRRDVQPVAALVQRQNAPRLGNPGVEVFLVDLVDVEAGEVEQRHAEGARGEHGELLRRSGACRTAPARRTARRTTATASAAPRLRIRT